MLRRSGIARSLDPTVPPNLAIIVLSGCVLLATGIGAALGGAGPVEVVVQAFGRSLSVFLAWALCREADPDHAPSALLSGVGTAACMLRLPVPDVIMLVWFLLLLRILNRTSGHTATTADCGVLVFFTFWPQWVGMVLAGPLAAAALLLDGRLNRPAAGRLLPAAIALMAAVAALCAGRYAVISSLTFPEMLLVLTGTVLFIPVISASRHLHSLDDTGFSSLDSRRVRSAQALALLGAIGAAPLGVFAIAPLWSALLSAGVWHLLRMVGGGRPTG
ncbi:hypothetical protein [Methanofollis fontis]|uniref:Uncharacterized protein n=1 Tax=Methanofollis fontis TaxID=2052832 RepID=A0A483CQU6_9EURY|nr:hypothetical protein [Methanofollis fontis]TAJ43259.1 hypothetical protein CUJ86_11495 [Methanofollis fontis]